MELRMCSTLGPLGTFMLTATLYVYSKMLENVNHNLLHFAMK